MKRDSKIDSILTVLFLLLAVTAAICYFVWPDNRMPFLYSGGAAICIRLAQYVMRFIS